MSVTWRVITSESEFMSKGLVACQAGFEYQRLCLSPGWIDDIKCHEHRLGQIDFSRVVINLNDKMAGLWIAMSGSSRHALEEMAGFSLAKRL